MRIGLAWATLDDERLAQSNFANAVDYFERKGLGPDDGLGARAAAEARFRQAEKKYQAFRAKKLDPKTMRRHDSLSIKQLKSLANDRESLWADYEDVIAKYRSPEWEVAALLRTGNINEEFARKFLDLPCPAEIKSAQGAEGCFQYKVQLEELVAPIMEKAIIAYETAADRATELNVAGEWTRLARKKVCEFTPRKCESSR